jgi:hypothetical protein
MGPRELGMAAEHSYVVMFEDHIILHMVLA